MTDRTPWDKISHHRLTTPTGLTFVFPKNVCILACLNIFTAESEKDGSTQWFSIRRTQLDFLFDI